MKKILYSVVVCTYIFVAGCAIFSLFFVPGYATLRVAAWLGAVLAFPFAWECFKGLPPGK